MTNGPIVASAYRDYKNSRYKFIGYQVFMSPDRSLTKRELFGLGELLSKIGGLYSALYTLGWVMVVLFGHWNMQAKLVERLYEPKVKDDTTARGLCKKTFIKFSSKSRTLVLEKLERPKCV